MTIKRPEMPTIPLLPNIAIVGESAAGKSTSAENFDPEKIFVAAAEAKNMPFKNGVKIQQMVVDSVADFKNSIITARRNEKINVFFVDSATELAEIFQWEGKKKLGKGYDMWEYVQEHLFNVTRSTKMHLPFIVVMTFHPHYDLSNDNTEMIKAKVAGKASLGIEKRFTICLHSFCRTNAKTDEDEYVFLTGGTYEGTRTSAKCPKGMFSKDEKFIPNDLSIVVNRAIEYQELELDKYQEDITVFIKNSKAYVKQFNLKKTSKIRSVIKKAIDDRDYFTLDKLMKKLEKAKGEKK